MERVAEFLTSLADINQELVAFSGNIVGEFLIKARYQTSLSVRLNDDDAVNTTFANGEGLAGQVTCSFDINHDTWRRIDRETRRGL